MLKVPMQNIKPLNNKGFGLLGILIVVIILAAVSGAGVYVYHQQHKQHDKRTSAVAASTSNKTTTSTKTTTAAPSPYAGWKSYELPIDKLSFMYPSDWSIDTPQPISPIGSTQDFVQFRAADGFYFDISDGGYQYGAEGSYLASSSPIPVKFTSQSCDLVLEYSSSYPHSPNQTGSPTVSNLVYGGVLLTNASTPNSLPNDQNAVGRNTFDGTSNSKAVSISFAYKTPITLAEAKSSTDTKNAELVIASMHY